MRYTAMVKVQAGRADAFAKTPDASIQAILVYGPDVGLVSERVGMLIKSVLKGDADPFRFTDINGDVIKSDPARLSDEAAAIGLAGGRRVVRICDAADGISKTVDSFLKHPMGDTLLVFSAGDLGPRSSLRKVFESADNAAALPCYADDPNALDQLIRDTLKRHGLSIHSEALSWLVGHLGVDRLLSRQEIEKLALYKGSGDNGENTTVTLDDVFACVGDTAALDLDDLVYAMGDGNQLMVQRAYGRMVAEGASPISALTAASRHLMRLHQVLGLRSAGGSVDQAMQRLRPPVFFKRKGQFKAQAGRWSTALLARGLEMLTTAELQAKSTDMPAQALIERALMQVAAAGRRGRR